MPGPSAAGRIPSYTATADESLPATAIIDVITAAFREFSAKNLEKEKKPSIRKELEQAKQQSKVQHRQREKVKTKDRGVEL